MSLRSNNAPLLRYVLVRNLSIHDFNTRTDGVFVQLNHFYSEVQWGSKEAIWLIGENTISFPLTVRVYAVSRQDEMIGNAAAPLGEEELVENFLSSTLAHPNRKSQGGTTSSYQNTRLVFDTYIDTGLVPLQGVHLHDLTMLPTTEGFILFASDTGKLFAHRSDTSSSLKSYFPSPGSGTVFSSYKDNNNNQEEGEEDKETVLVQRFGQLATFQNMLECADVITTARASCERIQQEIETKLANLDLRKAEHDLRLQRKRNAREIKQKQVAWQIEQVKAEISELRRRNVVDQYKEEEEEEEVVAPPTTIATPQLQAMDLKLPLRISIRLTNVRSLELLHDAIRVYPLAGTCIRGADLLSGNENERSLALGHLAHLTRFISSLFDIPLRFTPIAFGSTSFVIDPLLFATQSLSRILGLFEIADNAGGLFPLFPGAKVRWKYESGVQLLFVCVHQLAEHLGGKFYVPTTVQKPSTLQSFHNLKVVLFKLGIEVKI